jgi:hypothetical protein
MKCRYAEGKCLARDEVREHGKKSKELSDTRLSQRVLGYFARADVGDDGWKVLCSEGH